ncbi:unnamed protein product [Caenorhabditis bovis]|uniref:Uncharacterized protein n=1 Tax=Caenorhabditis bovis TaxID=2654633 RepID=A0A8S1EIE2_9PELO|nr:unnamed protein product [Caenorhabditis bovis]
MKHAFVLISIVCGTLAYPALEQPSNVQYPVTQEAQQKPIVTAHHGFMLAAQPLPTVQQSTIQQPAHNFNHEQSSFSPLSAVSPNDEEYLFLAKSLENGATPHKNHIGLGTYAQALDSVKLPPCSSDGRSVTIDHLRISPDSLVQIARLAQAFGTNPDWRKLRVDDMKRALTTPTHQFAARSIGL